MKKIIISVFLFASVIASAQNDAVEDTAAKLVITAVGKPDGAKTAIKINNGGSSLKSSDGMVELIIPEGAVPKNTTISIQPITNLMANGNAKAYRLEPSGIHFQKPVQLIFHYDDEEIKDSMQLLMGIAMQDDKGQWFGLINYDVDTVAKTISGNINHFSDWSNFSSIKIVPDKARVKVTNYKTLEVAGVTPSPQINDEYLAPLEKKPKKVIWKVNNVTGGNSSTGTITGRMLGAYYTAPATVPNQNPVTVTANLAGLSIKFNGVVFNDLRLVSNILIYDNAYEVNIISSIDAPAGSELGTVTYKDTGSFVVSLNGKDTKIIEKVNKNVPDKLDYSGKCIITQLKKGSGNVHIIGAQSIKVTPPSAPVNNSWIEIAFKRAPTILPLLQIKCPPVGKGGWTTNTNAQGNAMIAPMIPAYPQYIKFETKEGEQVILEQGKPGEPIYIKITVKQVKDE